VSAQNPVGTITNSDLELAGTIAHQDVLALHTPTAKATNALVNVNMVVVHWSRHGSMTTSKAAAYLLHLHTLHQHHHQYSTNYDYISGPANDMVDNCSCIWHLSETALLTHFNTCYLQASGWRLCPLPRAMTSVLISTQQWQQCMLELYLPGPLPQTATGLSGQLSVHAYSWTPTSLTPPSIQCTSSMSLPSATIWETHPHSQLVQSHTVENALYSVGQMLALLGTPNPHLNMLGTMDFHLSHLLRGFMVADPAPN